jgi:hypothetical protein
MPLLPKLLSSSMENKLRSSSNPSEQQGNDNKAGQGSSTLPNGNFTSKSTDADKQSRSGWLNEFIIT